MSHIPCGRSVGQKDGRSEGPGQSGPIQTVPESSVRCRRGIIARDRNNVDQLAWTHNYLHDLESLWWVATWIVFFNSFRDPAKPEESFTGSRLDNQILGALSLFPRVMGQNSRLLGLTNRLKFHNLCRQLSSNNYIIHQYLDIVRIDILQQYRRIEETLPHRLNSNDPSGIYQRFRATFMLARKNSPDFDLTFIPDLKKPLEDPTKKTKRLRTTSGTGESSRPRKK